MKHRFTFQFLLVLIVALVLFQACKKYYFRSNYTDVNAVIHMSKNIKTKPFLKAHLKNGNVCIFTDAWEIDTVVNQVSGSGKTYDFNRIEIKSGHQTILVDSIILFETNKKLEIKNGPKIAGLMILGGLDAVIGIFCYANPKACFGSCPTFYLNPNNNFHYADAEGFSNAISPSLEYGDIDALNNPTNNEKQFKLYMKNEALETHCINDVHILAFPRTKGQRVYQTADDTFYLCKNKHPLKKAIAKEGDITKLLENEDKHERFSLADPDNMSSKEEVYLTFNAVNNDNQLGLIVDFRQTLMTTYIIYSAMGYMGNQVSDVFAQLEQNPKNIKKLQLGLKKELGNIDVYQWSDAQAKWVLQGSLNETGPIAINKQFIPLQSNSRNTPIQIKMVMNKGLWRLDCVALTEIIKKVEPIVLYPDKVKNKKDLVINAIQTLKDQSLYLYSMPGDEYTFSFELPALHDYELFLYSKGYYLEWMREQWYKEKNLKKLNQLVRQPKLYLKNEASAYKAYEKTMERAFWDSRIDTKTYSFYDE